MFCNPVLNFHQRMTGPEEYNQEEASVKHPVAFSSTGALIGFHFQGGRNRHTIPDGTGHRAVIGMHFMDSACYFLFSILEFKVIGHMDTSDHQHISIKTNLPPGFADQFSLVRRDPARFQRASQGAG